MGFASLYLSYGSESLARVTLFEFESGVRHTHCRPCPPGPGEAHVPPGHEKTARFVIDLTTSKAVPEAEFGKP